MSYDFEYRSLVASFIFCISIFVFSFEKGFLSNVLKLKLFVFMGKLSYSIYMTHAAVILVLISCLLISEKMFGIQIAPMVDGVRYINFGNSFVNNIAVFVTIGLILFISNITYHFIEVRGQNIGRTLINKRHSNFLS